MLSQLEQIASRVRELREILEIEAGDIAAKIGVDVDTYLGYENALTDIPVGKLYSIASAMGVDPTVFLLGDAPRMEDYTIVRAGKGFDVERYAGYKFSSLAYNYVGREMEPMIVTLDPTDTPPSLISHAGQEFNMVLEGTVAVHIGDHEHILKEGDSIYFNPALPHGQRAIGTVSKFLTVINENMKK